MRTSLFCAVLLSSTLVMAQSPTSQNRQDTTGVVGITLGQTARLNVVYPTAPAPILQVLCSATLSIVDNTGKVLKTTSLSQMIAGNAFSLDLNGDTDLGGSPRTQIYGYSISVVGCAFVTNLEVIDNSTQRTLFVVDSKTTFPFPATPPQAVTPSGAVVGQP